MPIRINLLAEALAVEELRRRDPVKRAIYGGCLVIALAVVWALSLGGTAMIVKSELKNLETEYNSKTNDYQKVLVNELKLAEVQKKLSALEQLATNRFLLGSMLNAIQTTTIDDVTLMRLKTEQVYTLIQETKAKTNGPRVTPGKPASMVEKITVLFEARDSSATPGDAVTVFARKIAGNAYLQQAVGETNEVRLKDLGAIQYTAEGKPFLLFTLECRYPEKVR